MEFINAILAIDWATYVPLFVTLVVGICTAIDMFVKATPTKRDDEVVLPVTSKVIGFFARFSLRRGNR